MYHLEERAIEHAVIPWCMENNVAVVGYSPFGSGDLPDENSKGGRILQKIAAEHNATPRQIALAFLLRDDPLFIIPKSSDPQHTAENASAATLQLTPQEIAQIDAAYPRGRKPRYLPML